MRPAIVAGIAIAACTGRETPRLERVARVALPDRATMATFDGTYLYVIGDAGLVILRDEGERFVETGRVLGTLGASSGGGGLALVRGHALISRRAVLEAIDVRDPAAPAVVQAIDLGPDIAEIVNIELHGDRALVFSRIGLSSAYLHVVDITDLAALRVTHQRQLGIEVSTLDAIGVSRFAVARDHVYGGGYVATPSMSPDPGDGLAAYALASVDAPVRLDLPPLPGGDFAVVADDSTLVVGVECGVHVYDIAGGAPVLDPGRGWHQGQPGTCGGDNGVGAVAGGLLLFADDDTLGVSAILLDELGLGTLALENGASQGTPDVVTALSARGAFVAATWTGGVDVLRAE